MHGGGWEAVLFLIEHLLFDFPELSAPLDFA
jgi:hypothetical protein